MKYAETSRGFSLIEFKDLYSAECNIQKSSLATDNAIWIGISNPDPKIMASKTPKGGIGWVPYEISEDVLITTRMHINQDQAKEVVKVLNYFIKHGELPITKKDV